MTDWIKAVHPWKLRCTRCGAWEQLQEDEPVRKLLQRCEAFVELHSGCEERMVGLPLYRL